MALFFLGWVGGCKGGCLAGVWSGVRGVAESSWFKADGARATWGSPTYGGSGAPTDTGYTAVFSTYYAFAALKADGAITVWGDSSTGGATAPTDAGTAGEASA